MWCRWLHPEPPCNQLVLPFSSTSPAANREKADLLRWLMQHSTPRMMCYLITVILKQPSINLGWVDMC